MSPNRFTTQYEQKFLNGLPSLEDLKYNASSYIACNSNKKIKAYDFMGYPKRKEIYEGLPDNANEYRFENVNLNPAISTKHKRNIDFLFRT